MPFSHVEGDRGHPCLLARCCSFVARERKGVFVQEVFHQDDFFLSQQFLEWLYGGLGVRVCVFWNCRGLWVLLFSRLVKFYQGL